MGDSLLVATAVVAITAFLCGFAVAYMLGSRTRERLAETKARSEAQAQAAADKLELVADARSSLTDAFKALSMEALDTTNERFLTLATAKLEKLQERAQGELVAREQAVEHLVQPIRESLAHVDGKIGELEKARVHAYARLDEQLRGIGETQSLLRTETSNLVKALRQPTVRGRWGEMQLKRVVETAGMSEHCDFVEQESAATDGERLLRPDLVVKLPGGRHVVVDAKAPIAAYLDALEATEEDASRAHLKRHAQLVRAHVQSLGRKAYWEAFSPSPEFVILFLPGEVFFSAALEIDAALMEYGASQKVMLATPSNLIAMLRTVAYGWTQEALALNAQQVADLGRELYERVAKLAEHWGEVGERLGKAVESYNKGVGTLESRVLVTARKFQGLQAAPEGEEIEAPEPVDTVPRALQAPELVPSGPTASVERIARIG